MPLRTNGLLVIYLIIIYNMSNYRRRLIESYPNTPQVFYVHRIQMLDFGAKRSPTKPTFHFQL